MQIYIYVYGIDGYSVTIPQARDIPYIPGVYWGHSKFKLSPRCVLSCGSDLHI